MTTKLDRVTAAIAARIGLRPAIVRGVAAGIAVVALVAAVAVPVNLLAQTAASTIAPAPTKRISNETPEPAETPTPEATVNPTDALWPRVLVPCDEMADAKTLAAVLGNTIAAEPQERFGALITAAEAQAGLTACRWWGDSGMVIWVLPGEVDDLPALIPDWDAWGAEGIPADFSPLGAEASGICFEGGGDFDCSVLFAAGSYLLEADLFVSDVLLATAAPLFIAALEAFAENLEAAGAPTAAWQSPVTASAEPARCPADFDPKGKIFAALGMTHDYPMEEPGRGSLPVLMEKAWRDGGLVACIGTGYLVGTPDERSSFSVQFLPGSEWFWDVQGYGTSATEFQVAGASRARGSCTDGQCTVEAIVEHSYVVLYGGPGADLPAIVAALEAALPLIAARIDPA